MVRLRTRRKQAGVRLSNSMHDTRLAGAAGVW